jgi:hypothetical protein
MENKKLYELRKEFLSHTKGVKRCETLFESISDKCSNQVTDENGGIRCKGKKVTGKRGFVDIGWCNLTHCPLALTEEDVANEKFVNSLRESTATFDQNKKKCPHYVSNDSGLLPEVCCNYNSKEYTKTCRRSRCPLINEE